LSKDAPQDVIFTLKQTGEKLKLAEVAEDPEAARLREAEGPKLSKADLARLQKEDDI
jgi:hypothetical protein